MATKEVNQMLAAAAAACEDKKAEDIRILALDPSESGLADYFLICNGTNDRQNVAITDEIEIRLKREFGTYPYSVEGRRQGEWVIMDYVDFIVHVFSPEKRAYYGLERLRKSATSLSIDDLNAEIKNAVTSARKKVEAKKSAKAAEQEDASAAAKKAGTAGKKLAAKKTSAKKSPAKGATKAVPVAKKAAKKTVADSAEKKTPKKRS